MNFNVLSQLVYEEIVKCIANYQEAFDPEYFIVLSQLRQLMLRKADPLIRMQVGNMALLMNLSHQLPLYRALFPLYDTALPRLAKAIFQNEKVLKVIDVGANIGDTTCLISQVVPGSFLCIEGDPGYFSILKENVQTMNLSVTCVQAFCGDNDGQMEGVITVKDGTGYFAVNDNQKTVMTSLQNIIMDNPEFQYANLLKIDTDGFDFSVSRGAQKLLAESGPTVFFEFVPATLINKGEQPLEIFSYFLSLGYQHGLFYDNFGLPLAVVDMDDRLTLAEMIKRTNNNQTSYFDILLPGRNLDSKWFHLFCEEEFAYGAKCSELHETIIKYSLSMPLKLKII